MAEFISPDPLVVLERFVAVTGAQQLSPDNFPASAIVTFAMRPDAIDHVDITIQDGSGRNGHAPIGHYDPAAGRWRFPGEYVEPHEREGFTGHAELLYPFVSKNLTPKILDQGATVVDAQHSLTRSARQDIASVLEPLNPREWLARDGVVDQLQHNGHERGKFIAADEFTIMYATLNRARGELTHTEHVGVNDSITHTHPVVVPSGILSLSYAGVKVEADAGPGYTVRSTRGLCLASIDPSTPEGWAPNLDAITLEEWEVVKNLPHIIKGYAAANRKFSPAHCARVRKIGLVS
jgi:hypothetical protein